MDGFLNLLKPTGMTSSDAVVRTRGILKSKLNSCDKVGHFGTLDPGAAGVLPIAIGRATKLFDYGVSDVKKYRAGFAFGVTTDTLDSYGTVTARSDNVPDVERVCAALKNIEGEICQIPPLYSSKSVNGARAYDLARRGVEFELKGRPVTIYGVEFVRRTGDVSEFDITCSGGTYIRSIVRDVAAALGTCGYMAYLIRTKSGVFDIDGAVGFDEFEERLSDCVLPVTVFTDGLPRFDVDGKYEKQLKNGVKLKLRGLPEGAFSVYLEGKLFGVAKNNGGIMNIEVRLD